MYVDPVLVSSFLHLLPLHSWSQQLYSPVSAAVEFARISWLYLSSCFILWRNKNKRQGQAQMYFPVYFCQLISTFDFFIPSLQLTTSHFQSSVATSPFAPAETVYMSSFLDFNYKQELTSFSRVQFIPGLLQVSILKLGCDCSRPYVHLCFSLVCPCIVLSFILHINPHASQSFFNTVTLLQ